MNRILSRTRELPALTLVGAAVLLLGGLVLAVGPSRAADTPAATSKPALTVSLTRPQQGNLPMKLSANGNVAAWQEAVIGSEVNGLRLADVRVNVGDRVQRNQVLAVFASESVAADVAAAKAGAAEAQAMAAEAKANADRARAVQSSGVYSAQQINQILTAEQTALARFDSAKAMLEVQQLRLKNTTVVAPDAGTISARNAAVGAVAGAGTELFKLIRQSRLEWRAEVTSAELGRVKPGTKVKLTTASGASVDGKVRAIAPTVDPATRTGLVYVDIPNAGGANAPARAAGPSQGARAPSGGSEAHAVASVGAPVLAGMFARGEFELGASSGMTVANTAVVVRDGFSYVYRVGKDNRVSQLKVQTGRTVGTQIELLGGVKPDDQLVASGASFLSEGDLVRVVGNGVTQAPAAK